MIFKIYKSSLFFITINLISIIKSETGTGTVSDFVSFSKDLDENILKSDDKLLTKSPKSIKSQTTTPVAYWDAFGEFDSSKCSLDKGLKKEIKSYQEIVDLILSTTLKGNFKGETYKHLAHFTDFFGSRLVTSSTHSKAVNFLNRQLLNIPTLYSKVYFEDVNIPNWRRGIERGEILSPIQKKIDVKGMGLGISTKSEGLTGEAIVIDTLEELRLNKFNIAGKILVLNLNFYETKSILSSVAVRGALLGAIGVLVRSPAPLSIYSPQMALLQYSEKARKIPAGTITLEDAELMSRLYKKGKKVIVNFILESTELFSASSQNIIADLDGREFIDQYVLVSGSTDSWDIGQGAVDGLGGILTYELARIFDELKLYPRRTVRAALFTGSKFGHLGALKYLDNHESSLNKKHVAALSANLGCFRYRGFVFSGSYAAACTISEILKLLPSPFSLVLVNGTVSDASLFSSPTVGVGNSPSSVPSLTLNGDDGHLYWFGDSEGDTVSIFDSSALDMCLGAYTALTYVIADLTEMLPK